MKKLTFLIFPILMLSGCKSIPTSISDAFPFKQPKAEPLYFTVDRCSDDMIDFFEKDTSSMSSEELALTRGLGERYAMEKMNCVDPNKYEKLELSDRCRYKNNGELECAGSVDWILDPANYKIREGALKEREQVHARLETVEIIWEYVTETHNEVIHNSSITRYNLAEYKDKIDKLKKDKRCVVQRNGKKLVCKMKPTADFPVHRGMLPASAYRGW